MNNRSVNAMNSVPNVRKEHGIKRFDEQRLIRNFIRATGLDYSAKILDVGCGFGRVMSWLIEDGYNPEGIDINPYTVETNKKKSFHCMTPEEFTKTDEMYDILLMIHIVEHFQPTDLLDFIDIYLDRLKVGGYLLIATPLEQDQFYADFDHIKVYQPGAFSLISKKETQVQYHSRHRLRMVCFGLKRQQWDAPAYEDYYCSFNKAGFLWKLSRSIRYRLSWFIFKNSGGSLGGLTTGWVGMYQKE
jgi:2-polyprenyl-3-methyl-5-hydroxy-6-metoxy-1,4-benzoquinol methylase